MRKLRNFVILTIGILGCCTSALAADVGYIQIKAEEGLQVLLDGTFRGVTKTNVGGLILPDVPVGTHTLEIVKLGFRPQTNTFALGKDRVYVYEVSAFEPAVRVSEFGGSESGDIVKHVGTLEIRTIPVDAEIWVPVIRKEQFKKSQEVWTAEDIPAGKVDITIRALEKSLTYSYALRPGQRVRLLADLLQGKMRNLTEEEEVKVAAETSARLAQEETTRKAAATEKARGESVQKRFIQGEKFMFRSAADSAGHTTGIAFQPDGGGVEALIQEWGNRYVAGTAVPGYYWRVRVTGFRDFRTEATGIASMVGMIRESASGVWYHQSSPFKCVLASDDSYVDLENGGVTMRCYREAR